MTSMRRLRRRPCRRARPLPTGRPGPRCPSTGPRNPHRPGPNLHHLRCPSTRPGNPGRPDPSRGRRHPGPGPRARLPQPDMRAGTSAMPPTAPIPHTGGNRQHPVRRCRCVPARTRQRQRATPDTRSRGRAVSRTSRRRRGKRLLPHPPRRTATAGRAPTNPLPRFNLLRSPAPRTALHTENSRYPTSTSNRHRRSRPPKWCRDAAGGAGSTP